MDADALAILPGLSGSGPPLGESEAWKHLRLPAFISVFQSRNKKGR